MHTPLERVPLAAPLLVAGAFAGLMFRLGHHLWTMVDDGIVDLGDDLEPFA